MVPHKNRMMRTLPALLFPFITCWLQWQFWSIFKPFVWFLFFPTVFFSSRIGGKFVGVASTLISALLVVYFFIPPQFSFTDKPNNNLYSVIIFLIMGFLFCYTHERLEQAKLRAIEAQEAVRVANLQLQEAVIGRLQAEQGLTEDHLHKSEERFRQLFNKAPVPLCFVKKDGVLNDINDRFVQMFGYTLENVATLEEWWRRTSPDADYRAWATNAWRAAVERAATTGSDIEPIEYNVTCKQGVVRTVLISGIALGDDILATFFDVTERRLAEASLRESGYRFRSIFDNSPIAIGIGRRDDGRLVEVNDAWLKLSGFERDEVIGRATTELNLYFRAEERNEIIEIINERGQILNREVRLRRKAGDIIDVQYSAELIELGGESFLQAMMTDITERKLAEEALQRYRLLSANSRDIIFFIRSDGGVILEANEAALKAYGYSHAELLGLTIRDIRAPETLVLTPAEMVEADERGILFETIHIRKDGSRFPVEVSSQGATIGNGRVLVSVVRDITARKQVEEQLKEREFRLKRAEEMAHLGHWRYDLASGLVTCSDEMCRIFGFQREAEARTLPPAGIMAFCHPEDRECCAQSFDPSGQLAFNSFEYRILRPDGEERQVASKGELIRDGSGRVIAVFGAILDTSELKRKERELQEKNTELERFTYMISHDLKSPLVTIKTFLGYLEKDMANSDAERIGKDIHFMATAAGRMELMLGELLEMSRVGRQLNQPVSVTCGELVEEALSMVAGPIAAGGIEVLAAIPDITFFGDRQRLVEIWQNLLENACKFMGNQAHPAIELGAEGAGRATIFFVRDNGVGIEPQYQEKVFGMFEKLDRNSDGTGLGLALVRRIVELNGGKIMVESQGRGRGACFRFTIPGAVEDSLQRVMVQSA